MKIRIEPYKTWSGGAKALGLRAGILRATKRQVAKHGDFDVIINWGRSEKRFKGAYLNKPEAVVRASDKLQSFEAFRAGGVPCPPFTSDRDVAQEWWANGDTVVARTLLRANGGRGIVLASKESGVELPRAPLYCTYVKKREEYRIHVFDGQVVDVQQKRRKTDVPDDQVDWRVRNHANGWIFARDNVNPPACVLRAAVSAVGALGLDFGAVDTGYNAKKDEACVYEVNTAPGLEGTTLDKYYEALVQKFQVLKGGRYKIRRSAQ